MTIQRALPVRGRRMVGAWCFLDRFGPFEFADTRPIDVPPHPHIGLQTLTWLARGEALHRDSLGSEALARPGYVNVMTAGRGIAHAEQTPRTNSGRLEGAQLWIALPDAARHSAPAFEQTEIVRHDLGDGELELFVGRYATLVSNSTVHSPIVGVSLVVRSERAMELELDPQFEYAFVPLEGVFALDGREVSPGTLVYRAPGAASLEVRGVRDARALLLGGAPFGERIMMWWNFVARSNGELAEARDAWQTRQRFGTVAGFGDTRMDAPPLYRVSGA
jgi:redox-sensitive bicupin YhaK (pirin superfamily)